MTGSVSPLQLGWTGAELVGWWWDGRAVLSRGNDGTRLYSELVNQWGWMPPGAAALRIEVELPLGTATVPAIALPPISWPAQRRAALRRPSVSMRWCADAVRLAGRIVGSGNAVPELRSETNRGPWEARWVALAGEEIDAAIADLALRQPPVVRAVAALGGRRQVGDQHESTRAMVAWLVDSLARSGLRQMRWSPPLKGLRGPEATAARALAGSLTRSDARLATLRDEAERSVPQLAGALRTLQARLAGEPVVDVRLRLALPAGAAEEPWPLGFELVDRLDASRWCTAGDVWEATPLAVDLAGDERHLTVLSAALLDARRRLAAEPATRAVADAFDASQPAIAELDLVGASTVLEQIGPLTDAGLPVHVPGQLLPATARVRGAAKPAPPAASGGRLGTKALVSWSMVVDGRQVSAATLERAVAAGSSLLNVDGRWVQLDQAAARKALAELSKHRAHHELVDPAELLRLAAEAAAIGEQSGFGALDLDEDDSPGDDWVRDLLAGLPDAALEEGIVPDGFVAELRPYQRRGLGWMQFLARLGLGGCLADDMGLGKTPTSLAHLVGRSGPQLVICPLSVVRNWENEAARFTPGLRVHVHHGAGRTRGEELAEELRDAELVISTYGLVARDIEHLASIEWTTVILDEAQAVKNAHTKAARAVRKLRATQKLALTGTPVENRLGELWSILDAVNHGLLGSEHRFRERWATPIERDGDEQTAAQLRRLTSPFVLRRTKADKTLVPDLPDKVEQVAWASLTQEQAAMYQAVTDQLLRAAEQADGMQRRGLVLAALTRLKQICNHPAQALGDGSRLAGRSGKLTRFDELITDLLDAGEKALVFTQYRTMGELLQRHLVEAFGLHSPFLHGGVSKARRDRMVDHFQQGEGGPLLLVSLKAGGTGLNLTAASRVVHYDRWWNPAVEDQATDRAWRIGQQQSVFVHKLVCQGTLEERIAQLIDDKRKLAGLVIGGGGEAWLSELSTDALRDLITLDPSGVS